jgi:hypothetical protein
VAVENEEDLARLGEAGTTAVYTPARMERE